MYFKSIEIENVGPFVKFEKKLTCGSIGIFGRNGSGKSTLVNLMYSLVTGDFSRFAGLKTDMVRGSADAKAPSYVSGVITHADKKIKITRNIRTTKTRPNTVAIVDGETISDADKAQEAIYATLGISKKFLDLYVFKQQHTIYDFLTTTPTERAKAYQVLCGTESCERIWEMLGSFLNKDREVLTEIVDDSDVINQSISELRATKQELQEKWQQLAANVLSESQLAKYNAIVTNAQQVSSMRGQISISVAACRELRAETESMQAAITTQESVHKKRFALYESKKEEAENINVALKDVLRYQNLIKRRDILAGKLKRSKTRLANIEVPVKPDEPLTFAELKAEHKELRKRVASAKNVIDTFDATGRTSCPTCGTSVSDLHDHIKECKEVYETGTITLKELEKRIEVVERYNGLYSHYVDEHLEAEKEVADYTAELRGLVVDENEPTEDVDSLEAKLNKFKELEKEIKSSEVSLTNKKKALAGKEGQLEAERKNLIRLREKLAEHKKETGNVEEAINATLLHNTTRIDLAKIEGEMKGLTRDIKDKTDQLNRLRSKLNRSRKIKAMASIISKVRDTLHRDGLPHRVAQANLARMQIDVNKNLAKFDDPFWVETDDTLSFIVHKPGEKPHIAARLSTGQRVVLALAFWPAVASLWGDELGMLVLDEPTANLDTENRKLLADAISTMTAKVRGERQLVMVTHDHDLRSSFDQVIDLGE